MNLCYDTCVGERFAVDILHIIIVERNRSNLFCSNINRHPDLISDKRKINVDLKNCSVGTLLVETLSAVTCFVCDNVNQKNAM